MRALSLLILLPFFFLNPVVAQAEAVPATSYFPVLPLDAPADSDPQLVPLAINQPFDANHVGVTRAIVVIHDEARDAPSALAMMSALAGSQNASTIILAPQFLLPSDIVRFADYLPENGRGFAAWQVLGWSFGDDSMPVPSRKSISSFTVVDLLLMYLSDRGAFPDLKEIVVAGFGVGANFTQRYAAFTAASDAVAKQNVNLRYLVAAPSSYLYQTVSRPMGGNKGFGPGDTKTCPAVNAYPYGLEKLNPYAGRRGANAAKTDYAMRFITYLNAQAPDAAPEISCAAMAQGYNSWARAENYRLYLRTLYSDVAARTQTFARVKGDKNDAVSLFGSACGMATLFGDGLCAPSEGNIR